MKAVANNEDKPEVESGGCCGNRQKCTCTVGVHKKNIKQSNGRDKKWKWRANKSEEREQLTIELELDRTQPKEWSSKYRQQVTKQQKKKQFISVWYTIKILIC